ncbi:MAG: hypothetical protein NVSMB6_17170 [Burkholderiaceae bacterium]
MTELPLTSGTGLTNLDYRNVLDALGEGLILIDPIFTILDVNAELLRLAGRRREDLVGRPYWEVWPESVGTPIETAYRQVMQERVAVTVKYRLAFPHLTCWLEIRAYPVKTGIAAFLRDITLAEQALEALQESEGRFRAAVAATGVMWTNDADGKMSGEQLAWSGRTGQSRAEYEGYGWATASHPDDVQPTLTGWEAAVAQRRTFEGELR